MCVLTFELEDLSVCVIILVGKNLLTTERCNCIKEDAQCPEYAKIRGKCIVPAGTLNCCIR